MEAVTGQKYIEGQWMYSGKRKDCEKRSWVRVEDMAVCQVLVETGMLHIPCRPTTHPTNDGNNGWKEMDGGKMGGREEIHCMDHN